MMQLTLVRHTSVAVQPGVCYGITDVPLAITFPAEAALVKEDLKKTNFDVVFSSPLSRCTRLAEFVFPGRKIFYDRRLTELNFGQWENCRWDNFTASDEARKWFANYWTTRCPGGESYAELIERVRSFGSEISRNGFRHALAFTHAGVIRSAYCLLKNISPEESFNLKPEYGQSVSFDVDEQDFDK